MAKKPSPKTDSVKTTQSKTAKTKGTKTKAPRDLFQFKITLKNFAPPIWRRIVVPDGTLDDLHEHIQTAMGWTNSHLHQFLINGTCYGDPDLLDDEWGSIEFTDSTAIKISDVIPKDARRFRFTYEYDFGDGWQHEILFEGYPPAEQGQKYPVCLEGKRACPPEDVGGVWGYADFLEAMANPRHERHDRLMEWSGPFDPEAFDSVVASKDMRKGLPNWRE